MSYQRSSSTSSTVAGVLLLNRRVCVSEGWLDEVTVSASTSDVRRGVSLGISVRMPIVCRAHGANVIFVASVLVNPPFQNVVGHAVPLGNSENVSVKRPVLRSVTECVAYCVGWPTEIFSSFPSAMACVGCGAINH